MFTWLTTIGVAAAFAAVGAYVDKLISIRHKAKLHLAMHRWWNRLDETKIPDFLVLIATSLSTRFEKILRNKHWRAIVGCSLVCCFFLFVAAFLDQKFSLPHEEEFIQFAKSPRDWIDKLPHALSFVVVFVFDFLTAIITLASLRVLKQSQKVQTVILMIALQIVVISILAVSCFASFIFASDFAVNHNLIGMQNERSERLLEAVQAFNYYASHQLITKEDFQSNPAVSSVPLLSTNTVVTYYHHGNSWVKDLEQTPPVLFGFIKGHASEKWTFDVAVTFQDGKQSIIFSGKQFFYLFPDDLFYAGTVCFPALIITLMLVFMLLAKFALGVVRGGVMYFFDLATEYDPKQFIPATLLGITCGLCAIVAKCSSEIILLIHSL